MFIKEVTTEGLQSYPRQFSKGFEKYNLLFFDEGERMFDAICFVLSDIFQKLPSDNSRILPHNQGSFASVCIVFDNSDKCIPVGNEEVRLSRMISLAEDKYFLDGQHITKTKLMNLLESAGLCRSYPYYVVQQENIASLASMTDSERLDLLKEIAGTKVYEEKRLKSQEIITDTGKKRTETSGILQKVQHILSRLHKGEVKDYKELDRQCESLKTSIYVKKLRDAQNKLAETESKKKEFEADLSTYLSRAMQECNAILSANEAELEEQPVKDGVVLGEDMMQELESVLKSIDEKIKQLDGIKDEKNKEDVYELKLQEEVNALENVLSDMSGYLKEQEGYLKEIMEDAPDMYPSRRIEQLYAEENSCIEELQKLSHVKEKALKHEEFTKKKEELTKEESELDKVHKRLTDYISDLDQMKDGLVLHTFGLVAEHFGKLFSELVKNGRGRLVMMEKEDGNHAGDGPSKADAEGRAEKYIGVKVEVSFPPGEETSMEQLSYSQKYVVALTLIMAIQQYDHAPFYLFYKIDEALNDRFSRTAFRRNIRQQAIQTDAQLLITIR